MNIASEASVYDRIVNDAIEWFENNPKDVVITGKFLSPRGRCIVTAAAGWDIIEGSAFRASTKYCLTKNQLWGLIRGFDDIPCHESDFLAYAAGQRARELLLPKYSKPRD